MFQPRNTSGPTEGHAAPKRHKHGKTIKPNAALQGLRAAKSTGAEKVAALSSPAPAAVAPPAVATPPSPSKPHTFNGQAPPPWSVATAVPGTQPVGADGGVKVGPKVAKGMK